MSRAQRAEFRQFIRQSVRWGDVDMLGHVNNAKFFTYSESARIEYFAPLKSNDPRFFTDCGLILASTSCDFLAQVRYPEELDVGMRIEKIGRSSMQARTCVFIGEAPVAIIGSTIVWFDYLQQKPLAVPLAVREWIRSREAVAPVES